MKKKLSNIFPKKLSNGKVIFYYTTYDENGKRRQFSTGKLTREEAYAECFKRLSEGKIVKRSKMIMGEFTKNWFIYGSCPYYSVRESKGRVYSRSSIENKRFTLLKHIIPTFGELRLDHITTKQIEDWLTEEVSDNYAINSINLYLSLLNLIFQEAVRLGYIDRNPCKSVLKFTGKKKRKVFYQQVKLKLYLTLRKENGYGYQSYSI